jgi:hypothetical protein
VVPLSPQLFSSIQDYLAIYSASGYVYFGIEVPQMDMADFFNGTGS